VPIPDEEMMRRCEEVFGGPLDANRRASLAGILDTLVRANTRIVGILESDSKPMGHTAVLKNARHDG
jgi:hypothetical protein